MDFNSKIGIFGNFFHKNHYPFESFVYVRLCWRIMATTTFAPPLDKVDPCLSNAVFSIRALLFWPTLEFEVLPGNIRIDHVTFTICIEIGFSLFDTYAVVNA